MASTKNISASAPAEAQEAPAETTQRPVPHQPRLDMPGAPTGLVSLSSRDMVARITLLMQGAFVNGRKHITAYEAAANAVGVLNMHGLHPLVGRYKAEALEWLAGRKQAAEAAVQEQAEADKGAAS